MTRKRLTITMPDGRRVPATVRPGTIDLDKEVVRLSDGRRLTNALAEEISEAAVAEYRRRGRPSLTGRATPSPQISFRIPPEARQRAQRLAKKTGKSLSALAREAFEARLRRSG
jgi:predicted HicB family RNase H-like nuclease